MIREEKSEATGKKVKWGQMKSDSWGRSQRSEETGMGTGEKRAVWEVGERGTVGCIGEEGGGRRSVCWEKISGGR